MSRRRHAFTLIELLVVIGIIMILMAILIPAVGKIRLHQQNAATAATMNRIAACITSYFGDFNAYPGALHNKQFTTSRTTTPTLAGGIAYTNYTQTEDCALALLGGLQANGSTLTFIPGEMGMGPPSYNPAAAAAKRYNAYMEYRVNDFTPQGPSGPVAIKDATQLQASYAQDSIAPEFMDNFGTQRPIIFMRANTGASPLQEKSIYNGKASGYDPQFHYDFGACAPYLNMNGTPPAQTEKRDFGGQAPNAAPQPNVGNFFTASNLKGARNAGGYMLISAGIDRVYGSPDDIIVGTGGGQ